MYICHSCAPGPRITAKMSECDRLPSLLASSGRSTCQKCKKSIDAGELQIEEQVATAISIRQGLPRSESALSVDTLPCPCKAKHLPMRGPGMQAHRRSLLTCAVAVVVVVDEFPPEGVLPQTIHCIPAEASQIMLPVSVCGTLHELPPCNFSSHEMLHAIRSVCLCP